MAHSAGSGAQQPGSSVSTSSGWYHLPGDLEAGIGVFVEHYNHRRHHESLGNLTPADAYSGRGPTILRERARIKRRPLHQRRLLHRKQAA